MINIIESENNKLYTKIYSNSNKESIILLHGGPALPFEFTEIVDLLKDNYQIITFHQRGTEYSPCYNGDYSMDAYIDDIELIRKFYKLDTFHLWGYSWGGLYAQLYADKFPENLLSIFL